MISQQEGSIQAAPKSVTPESRTESGVTCSCCPRIFRKRRSPSFSPPHVSLVAFPTPHPSPSQSQAHTSKPANGSSTTDSDLHRHDKQITLESGPLGKEHLQSAASTLRSENGVSPHGGIVDADIYSAAIASSVPDPARADSAARDLKIDAEDSTPSSPVAIAMALFGGARPRQPRAAASPSPPLLRKPNARHAASHSIAGVLDADAGPRMNQDRVVIRPALLRHGQIHLHTLPCHAHRPQARSCSDCAVPRRANAGSMAATSVFQVRPYAGDVVSVGQGWHRRAVSLRLPGSHSAVLSRSYLRAISEI